MSAGRLLQVRDLTVELRGPGGAAVPVVEEVSFELESGEFLGLVGESGTGKSVTVLALAGLLAPPLQVAPGSSILWRGRDLSGRGPDAWGELRGSSIGVLFQDPGGSLDPLYPVGIQVAEVVRTHRGLGKDAAREEAVSLLERVGLGDGNERFGAYPHELSGGEQQRVALAAALAGDPDLLLADEPTSALDAPVAAAVIGLLDDLRRETGVSLLMVSHDLGVVGRAADRAAVLYAGRIVEEGPVSRVLRSPSHPYTRGLLAALPGMDERGERRALDAMPGRVPPPGERPGGCRFRPRCPHAWEECEKEPGLLESGGGRARCWLVRSPERRRNVDHGAAGPREGPEGKSTHALPGDREPALLEARGLRRRYDGRPGGPGGLDGRALSGVAGLDLELRAGESVGLVGRSGSGKSTAARLLLRLERPDAGEILFRGRDAWALEGSELLAFRRAVQPVFQRPVASLNPRLTVGATVREPLEVHSLAKGGGAGGRAIRALERVGLDRAMAERYPHELSGGECQRAALARALVLGPRLLVADEPTSALDVSVQAAILDLLTGLREELGLGLLLISHDLAVIRHVCTRVLVMYQGRVVEEGPTERIFQSPQDERTRALVDQASDAVVPT